MNSKLGVLCVALLATTARAQVQFVTYSAQSPLAPIPFSNTLTALPQFDPALGSLLSMRVSAAIHVQGSLGVENLSPSPTGSGFAFYQVSATTSGGGTNFQSNGDVPLFLPAFTAYDGVTDHAGSSGTTFPITGVASAGDYLDFPPAKQDLWRGTGTVSLTTSTGNFVISPIQFNPNWSVGPSFQGYVELTVRYEYTDDPNEFCFGPCPCLASAGLGGCPNSSSASGGRLVPSSSSSISNDTFTLTASNLPPGTAVVFFQGTTHTQSGIVFGDGAMCAGGSIVRLALEFAPTGATQVPDAGDVALSIAGTIPGPGAQRAYQAFYRDASPGFCTSATFNLTNGARTRWQP
jgi:hypothetical protein